MNKSFSITILGSLNTDLSVFVNKFPDEGETIIGSKFVMGFGGKGANQGVASKYLGSDVAIIGKVGLDEFGRNFINHLDKLGVNTVGVTQTASSNTGAAFITVQADRGDNRIIVASGANMLLSIEDVDSAQFKGLLNTRVLVCQFETSAAPVLHAFQLARAQGTVTILNPAPAPIASIDQPTPHHPTHIDILNHILALSDFCCPNETEAMSISRMSMPVSGWGDTEQMNETPVATFSNCLHWLAKSGVKYPIVTMGSRGLVALLPRQSVKGTLPRDVNLLSSDSPDSSDKVIVHLLAPRISKVIDTTGAGDCFVGALAHFVANHDQIGVLEQLRRAVWIASQSVRKVGTQSSFPNREQLPADIFCDSTFHWPDL